MRGYLIGVLLCAVTFPSLGQSMKPSDRAAVYGGCTPSCLTNQRQDPKNAILQDFPFMLEAYCSCYCSKIAMRVSRGLIDRVERERAEGRDPLKLEEMAKLIDESGARCQSLFGR